ncbi:MAG: hypothetical protein ACYC4L_11395 [Chloroflexota bacterium]
MSKAKKFINGAIKRPGALRERLEQLRLVKPGQTIPPSVLREAATGKWGPKTKARAQLALTLRGLRRK